MKEAGFEWDDERDKENRQKHRVSFSEAQYAFLDPRRIVAEDIVNGSEENRFYCIGRVKDGISTFRSTYGNDVIRAYGAGYRRKGRKLHEDQNKAH